MERTNDMPNMGDWLSRITPLVEYMDAHSPEPRPGGAREAAEKGPWNSMYLDRLADELVRAYVSATLGVRHMPLKAFMEQLEKSVLVASLRLTGGNQKQAASLLSIKPTALFEKMRKHRIPHRREQSSSPAREEAQPGMD